VVVRFRPDNAREALLDSQRAGDELEKVHRQANALGY